MFSELDNFILDGTMQGDPVMGVDSIVLGAVTLTGVWSGLSASKAADFGGFQPDCSASLVVPSHVDISMSLIGKIGAVKGIRLRCINLDIGEALTTLFFEHSSEGTKI